ncbi:MAG: TRAP transporter small permease [Rhodospirillaceae bacterium]|nr:TRAP transporter small permease [Rhodospirillaceae bacterium]
MYIIASFATTALGLGVMQVVLRYVFNTGFHWAEALFTTLTIWAMLIAGSRAVRDGIHARVSIFEVVLPKMAIRACNLLSMLASLTLCSFFFYCGILYTQFVHQMGIASMETNVPEAINYAIVPLAMGAFSLRYIILIVEALKDPTTLDPPEHVNIEGGGV